MANADREGNDAAAQHKALDVVFALLQAEADADLIDADEAKVIARWLRTQRRLVGKGSNDKAAMP